MRHIKQICDSPYIVVVTAENEVLENNICMATGLFEIVNSNIPQDAQYIKFAEPVASTEATRTWVDAQNLLKVDKAAGSRLITSSEATILGNTAGANNGDNAPNSLYSGLATSKLNANDVSVTNARTPLAHSHPQSDIINLVTDLGTKVDKITGKVLSTNDYTTAEQTKVTNLSGVNSGDNAVNSLYSGLATSKLNANDVSVTNARTPTAHTHPQSEITNLVSDLALKQATLLNNYSVTSQLPIALTRTYITGSNITVPSTKLRVGSMLRWTIDLTKTLAGVGTSTFDICIGTTGTTADTARMIFIKPVGTAAVDAGKVVIECLIRSIGITGVAVGQFNMTHNLASTGHMTIPACNITTVSSGFDMTVANLIVGVCITTGLADVITIQMVKAEALNL